MIVNFHTLFKIVVIVACVVAAYWILKYLPSDDGDGVGGATV